MPSADGAQATVLVLALPFSFVVVELRLTDCVQHEAPKIARARMGRISLIFISSWWVMADKAADK